MNTIKLLSSENAVTEVVDFVTLLGIFVISIGLIGLVGYPMLKKTQDENNIESTKQGFVVLAENINKVVMGQSPSQSVELKMHGEMLSVIPASARRSTINITVNNGSSNISYEYDLGVIEATYDNAIIGYENTGAWINYTSRVTIMISKPEFIISSENVYIPVTTIGGSSSVGGSGLVRVFAEEIASEDLINIPNASWIRIIVNSSYTEGWQERFLKETKSWTVRIPGELIMGRDFDPPVNVYIQRKLIYVEIQ